MIIDKLGQVGPYNFAPQHPDTSNGSTSAGTPNPSGCDPLALAAIKLGGDNLGSLSLASLSEIITQGGKENRRQAIALWVIHRDHLYCGTIEDFCERTFHICRAQGHRLIAFADVYLDLLKVGYARGADLTDFLNCETHARPLCRLTSAEQRYEAAMLAIQACKKQKRVPGEREYRNAVYQLVPSLRPVNSAKNATDDSQPQTASQAQVQSLIDEIAAMLPAHTPVQAKLDQLRTLV